MKKLFLAPLSPWLPHYPYPLLGLDASTYSYIFFVLHVTSLYHELNVCYRNSRLPVNITQTSSPVSTCVNLFDVHLKIYWLSGPYVGLGQC